MNRRTMKYRRKTTKKRNYFLGGFFITMFLAMIALGASHLFIKNPKAAEEVIVSSEIYPGLNLKTTTQEADIYTLFISQPSTNIKEVDESIEEFINLNRDDFMTEVREAEPMLTANDFSAHLNIQTTTKKLADKIYSLELEAYKIVGGANGSMNIQPFILDLNTKEQLTTADILNMDTNSIDNIKEMIYEEIQMNPEVNGFIFDNLFDQALENPASWKLSISQDAISFHFNQGEIAAAATGNIKIDIPMETILHELNPIFAEKMDIEIPEKPVVLDPNGKYIALTFDDGPHAEVTPRILDTLDQYNAKATFYMLGSQVGYYPSIAKQVLEEGHEIGNHTMSHMDLTRLSQSQIREEIQRSSNNILEATGSLPTSLRPPYGAFNDSVEAVTQELELPVIMWSVDSLDWKSRNAQAVNHEIMTTVFPGAIVLMHDIHATTADALPQLLANLENEGYEFITVSQLLEFGELKGIGPHHGVNQ